MDNSNSREDEEFLMPLSEWQKRREKKHVETIWLFAKFASWVLVVMLVATLIDKFFGTHLVDFVG